MTPTEMYDKIGAILPNAIFDEDSSGEITIATGYTFNKNNELIEVTK